MSDILGAAGGAYDDFGLMNPYSDSFNPSQAIPEQAQLPGIMGMLESEGFAQVTRTTNPLTLGGFAAFRSQNTLLQGGIGDDVGGIRNRLRNGNRIGPRS